MRKISRARVRVANGPAAGQSVVVDVTADGYPPPVALVAVVDRRAVALPTGVGLPAAWGAHVECTTYAAQQLGGGEWEYVAEGYSRV